jgi:hypothetical protein
MELTSISPLKKVHYPVGTIILCGLLLLQTAYFGWRLHAHRVREAGLANEAHRLRTVLGYSGMALGLPDDEVQRLKQHGLKDPVTDIVYDLVENRGYILPKEYLGREIGFRFKSDVQILSPRWLLADFDDGRLNGKVLLEYKITDGGRITWRIIDSYLNKKHENPDRA